jgi:hypothetical protein
MPLPVKTNLANIIARRPVIFPIEISSPPEIIKRDIHIVRIPRIEICCIIFKKFLNVKNFGFNKLAITQIKIITIIR